MERVDFGRTSTCSYEQHWACFAQTDAPPAHSIPRSGHGGLKGDQVKRLKDEETESARLREAVSDLALDKLILQEAARGHY